MKILEVSSAFLVLIFELNSNCLLHTAMVTGVMVGFSSIGSIISAQLFRQVWAPRYTQALGGTGGFQALAIAITAGLGIWMRRENRRRDKAMGLEKPLKAEDTPQCDLTDGERDPRFRYWT